MSRLNIGTGASTEAPFGLPPAVFTSAAAVLGIRGSGKTNTGVVLAEEAFAIGQQFVVLDPTDVWHGLRSSPDGKSPGLPVVVLGGNNGDLPLREGDAAPLADLIAETRQSVVLALSLFESKGAQRRFVTDFLRRLYRRKGEADNRRPLTVFIDEASLFAPQAAGAGDLELLGAVEDLVRRGRVNGFGVVLIDQRPASVAKGVLTQVELLVAHRTKGPQDRKALREWIAQHDDEGHEAQFLASLATLDTGEAWFWLPGRTDDVFERVHVRARRTFDSSATPALGEQPVAPKTLARPDITAWRARLEAASVAPAAKPARGSVVPDPEALSLRARVAQLERDLEVARGALAANREATARAIALLGGATGAAAPAPNGNGVHPAPRPATTPVATRPKPAPPDKAAATDPGDAAAPGGGLRRMLIALAQQARPTTAKAVGILAGLSSQSGTFSTYLGRGRAAGWIAGDRAGLNITAAGLEALGAFDPLPTGAALAEHWIAEAGGGAGRMLRALVEAWPAALARDALAEAAGLSAGSGTFSTYLGRLRTLQLVTGKDELRAAEDLIDRARLRAG